MKFKTYIYSFVAILITSKLYANTDNQDFIKKIQLTGVEKTSLSGKLDLDIYICKNDEFFNICEDEEFLTISGPESAIKNISVTVNDKLLKIEDQNTRKNIAKKEKIKASLYINKLNNINICGNINAMLKTPFLNDIFAIDLQGASNFSSGKKIITADKVYINLGGCSKAVAFINGNYLSSNIGGSSKLNLYGDIKEQFIELTGSSKFDGFGLIGESGKISLLGSSKANLDKKNKIQVSVSDTSKIVR